MASKALSLLISFLFPSSKQLENLRAKRRRYRTDSDNEELQTLPGTIVVLEESINVLALEMGSPEFCGMPEVSGTGNCCSKTGPQDLLSYFIDFVMLIVHNSDPKARILMRIQLSKEKLYEAKWGVIEWYNKWDNSGIGLSLI